MKAAIEIARREVKDNLATWKIPLAAVLVTTLLATGVLSLARSYEDATEAYHLVQDEHAASGGENEPTALAHRILAAPNALALLVGGPAEAVRAAFATPPAVTNETAAARQDPVRLRFPPTDLGTVGVGVLTLLAVLVSYDGIAGEKERGTLKVLLVNPLTRRDLLLGKYLGALASLLIPLFVAVLVALLTLRAVGIRFTPDEWARLLLVLGGLVLLLSAFVLVGLTASALTHRSPVAIVALLLAWLLLVAGAGGLASFAATADSKARSLDDVLVEMRLIDEHYDALAVDLARQEKALEERKRAQNGTLVPEDESRLAATKREIARLPALRAEDASALLSAYFSSGGLDLDRAETFAALSPAEAYRTVAQTVSRTDYGTSRASLDDFSAYLRELSTLKAEHAARGGKAADFLPPPYRSAPPTLGTDLARAAPFAALLVAENLVAFGAAAVAFGRYDVR